MIFRSLLGCNLALVVGLAVGLSAPAAAADTIVFAPSGGLVVDHDPGSPVNLGNVFTTSAAGRVTSLGFYTPTNLVGGGETVGLFDSTGTLLASTFVAVSVNTPGQYFFQSIAPVLLTAGQQYTVVNFVGQNGWAYGSVTSTGVNFDYNSYAYGTALAFTTSTGGSGPAYLGPNLTIGAVPEPATWAMMLTGFGLIGMAKRRRQKAAATFA